MQPQSLPFFFSFFSFFFFSPPSHLLPSSSSTKVAPSCAAAGLLAHHRDARKCGHLVSARSCSAVRSAGTRFDLVCCSLCAWHKLCNPSVGNSVIGVVVDHKRYTQCCSQCGLVKPRRQWHRWAGPRDCVGRRCTEPTDMYVALSQIPQRNFWKFPNQIFQCE